ncbi:MAG: hypothetical protein FJZ90_19575 [Chloroflexi bacterium]|nr:hypothetical protein [Chloroflexota bacterium]
MKVLKPYDIKRIVHIKGVDHPESIGIGPGGEAYTTGTAGQVYRINLADNTVTQFASTAPRRTLGLAVDADNDLYIADCSSDSKVIRITQEGKETTYARAPGGRPFMCANYPVFDRRGNLYLSDSGDWSSKINGRIFRIPPGGGEAQLWYPEPVDSPTMMALDRAERYLYFLECHGQGLARIAINPDGSAGAFERLLHFPYMVPHGIAFDTAGRIWLAIYRPDGVWIYYPDTRRLQRFTEDWRGEAVRGPTCLNFAGLQRDVLLVASLDNLVVQRLDNVGARGVRLTFPHIA